MSPVFASEHDELHGPRSCSSIPTKIPECRNQRTSIAHFFSSPQHQPIGLTLPVCSLGAWGLRPQRCTGIWAAFFLRSLSISVWLQTKVQGFQPGRGWPRLVLADTMHQRSRRLCKSRSQRIILAACRQSLLIKRRTPASHGRHRWHYSGCELTRLVDCSKYQKPLTSQAADASSQCRPHQTFQAATRNKHPSLRHLF